MSFNKAEMKTEDGIDDTQLAKQVYEYQCCQCRMIVPFIILWIVVMCLGITAAASNSEWHSAHVTNWRATGRRPSGPDLRLRRFAGSPGVCLGKLVSTSCYVSQSKARSSRGGGSDSRRQSSSSSSSSSKSGCYKWGWECRPLKDVVQNDVQNSTSMSAAKLVGFSPKHYSDVFITLAEAKLAWLCPGSESRQVKDLEAAAAVQITGILIILILSAFQFVLFVGYHVRIRFFVQKGLGRESCKFCFEPNDNGYSTDECCSSCCGCIQDTWGLRRVVGLLMAAVSGVIILGAVMLCIALPMIKRHFIERCDESRPSAEDLDYSRSEAIQIVFILFTFLLEILSLGIAAITLRRGPWDGMHGEGKSSAY